MQTKLLFLVSAFIISAVNARLFRDRERWWNPDSDDLKNSDAKSPLRSFVFNKWSQKYRDDREREFEEAEKSEEEIPFDPSVVIVDKSGTPPLPRIPSTKEIFDDIFKGMMPSFTSRRVPWWQGPNVCVERKEVEEGPVRNVSFIFNFGSTFCQETGTSYTCTKRIQNNEENKSYIEKRQCCYGYKKKGNKCEEFNIKELVPTMRDLGATRFLELLSSVNFIEKLNEGNFTVFCPTNEAITELQEDEEDNNIPEGRVVRRTDIDKIVTGHLVEGYLRSGDFIPNQILKSANGETGVRMNIYGGLKDEIYPNCAKIIGVNNYATNGVVHIIDRVLDTPTKTVMEIITSDPQFSILKGLFSQANMVQMLRDATGNYTLFAPTDDAFRNGKIDKELLQKMQEGKGCVTTVLKNLIVPHVICTSAISERVHIRNLIGKVLKLRRDENDKLFLNDIQLVGRDIVGINGVVHIIDDVLIPDDAKPLTEALSNAKRTDMLDLIETANMMSDVDNMKNFTFFVPKKHAIKELVSDNVDNIKNDSSAAKKLIQSHLVPTLVKSCGFHNNQLLPTLYQNTSLRVNKYDVIPGLTYKYTIQCVPIVSSIISYDSDVCEGTIHVVDEVLPLSKNTVMELLEELGLATFVRLLKKSGLDETLEKEGPYTILAPEDKAFEQLEDQNFAENPEKLKEILELHILPEMLCCAGIKHNHGFFLQQFVTTLGNTEFGVSRNHHSLRFSTARVTKCDNIAKNGVIHVVNKVIQPRKTNLFEVPDLFHDFFSSF